MLLFFIVLLGLFLRLTYIYKPEGLWNDEYVSWYVAATPFNNGFWEEILKQCHMPLYYLYLKPFAQYSDTILRLTSLLPGIAAIPVMYLIGKEYSRKTGIFAALITSVLPFLIYYSQEVRFYSLLFLASSLWLLFTIRLLKNYSKPNIIGYIISSLFIIFIHTLGIIYCCINLAYVLFKRKIFTKTVIIFLTAVFLLVSPLIFHIVQMLPASQWWGYFSYTNILFLFTDFFSPILTNHINAPPVFFYNKSLTFWLIIPTLIAFIGILFSKLRGFLLMCCTCILVISVLAYAGKIVFITKYLTEILPILVLAIAKGFDNLKKIGSILLTLYILIQLGSLLTPYYVTKLPRAEGNRIPVEIINRRKPNVLVYTYYEPERFLRYQKYVPKKTYSISKNDRYQSDKKIEEIFNSIKKNEKISVVFLDSVSFIDEKFINDNNIHNQIPEMFIIFSLTKHKIIKHLDKDFNNYNVDVMGNWTVITASKK